MLPRHAQWDDRQCKVEALIWEIQKNIELHNKLMVDLDDKSAIENIRMRDTNVTLNVARSLKDWFSSGKSSVKNIQKNLVPRIQNSRFLLTSDHITNQL